MKWPFERTEAAPVAGVRARPGSDRLIALVIAGAVLLLYVRTLFPDVGGTEDSPKFQYLGYVLGTAHSPGYPLYILVSHLFSQLPFGTLAYRISLMSACFGAATAVLVFLVLRHVRCHPLTAALAAISLSAGRHFWANAVIAEVYTMNAALWAITILKLLHWKSSKRSGDLYAAMAGAALALGNHLTILAIFPAMLAFLVLANHRWFRPRHILACIAILAAGVAQYGYIWLRTMQGAAYLEARASNLTELWEVITARRFAREMFAYDVRALLFERVPTLASMIGQELGVAGTIFAALGLVLLLRRRLPEGVLILLAALGVFGLTLNIAADAGGFLLPMFVLLWIAAGIGLEGIRRALTDRVQRRTVVVAAFTLIAAVPASQVLGNYHVDDRHGATFGARYFAALFDQLPARSVLVDTDYYRTHMLQYAIVSGQFERKDPPPIGIDPDPEVVQKLVDNGVSVFAFERDLDPLRGHGLAFAPYHLRGMTLEEYLRQIADGTLVVLAAHGVTIPDDLIRSLGGQAGSDGLSPRAIIGIKGNPDGAVQTSNGIEPATLSSRAGTPIGSPPTPLPVDASVVATASESLIRIQERDVLQAANGIGLVVLDRDGQVADRQVFDVDHGLTTVFGMGPWPMLQITGTAQCVALGDNQWHDITSIVSGSGFEARIDNFGSFDASVVVYAEADAAISPDLTFHYEGCQAYPCPYIFPPELTSQSFTPSSPEDLARLRTQLDEDGFGSIETLVRAPSITRSKVAANDQGQFVTVALDFDREPTKVFARALTDLQNPNRASACPSVRRGS